MSRQEDEGDSGDNYLMTSLNPVVKHSEGYGKPTVQIIPFGKSKGALEREVPKILWCGKRKNRVFWATTLTKN